jgi:hypothetical protein
MAELITHPAPAPAPVINNQTIAHSMLQAYALSTSSYFIKFIFIVVCLFDMYQLSALTPQKSQV